jgi:futalosine hydrolase
MILALAATEIELSPLQTLLREGMVPCLTLLTGVGPVEAAMRLAGFLASASEKIGPVINFGVAGGYVAGNGDAGPGLLDLYLAETESLGDFGICFPDRIEPLAEALTGAISFPLDKGLLDQALRICRDNTISVKTGNFVTVSGASATPERGEMLRRRFHAHCENMEGAAIARVCAEYRLPLLEIRCISNLVEERDPGAWRLQDACAKSARAAAELIKHLARSL